MIPKATAVVNYEVQHDFPDLGRKTMLVTARVLHHPDNNSHAMLLSIVDVTEQADRLAAKDMLFGELRHRMKNLFAVTQSMARQTATKGRSAEEYRDDFLGRFKALAEAQDLAFAEQDQTDLGTMIKRILAPYAATDEAIMIEPGPPLELGPRAIMSLGLVLHELATNAAKYGALSVSQGVVNISWVLDEGNSSLHLTWSERNGPVVSAPTKTGYGTKLIQYSSTYTLGGKVEQRYEVGGLQTEIVIPLGTASA